MKNIFKAILAVACAATLAASCIQETMPQSGFATKDQVIRAPGAYNLFVSALTSTMAGKFVYGGSNNYPYDFGYPAFFLMRDVMGQDLVYPYQNWYSNWYACGAGLGPGYAAAQLPWTYYYKWIKSCNEVIGLAGEEPGEETIAGAGQAYAMRAMFYMDLARMFANKPYTADKSAETVPYVDEKIKLEELSNNPRATNEVMWGNIIADLDKAEAYLAGYKRPDKYVVDLSVVYGLKARAYLEMGDWENAKNYAKKAQSGYRMMTAEEYTDKDKGFNTPNDSWMFAVQFKADDPAILNNDADSSWGSMMVMEISPLKGESQCGYAANYGQPFLIDKHLYETIPATDIRKNCFLDFAIDEMEDGPERDKALETYTTHPEYFPIETRISNYDGWGGTNFKFRPNGGDEGRKNQYIGFLMSVPLMRVEEMILIEAEAAGRLNEADGKALLTAFAQQRDPSFEYGKHNEAYYNSATSAFVNEVWWQRRIEFWGEGLATFDIKRLQKGIIRSYPQTNHPETYRWNVDHTPDWMNLCIVQTEGNYNKAATNNPAPIPPQSDSPEFVF